MNKKRRKFLELSKGSYSEHLELAKDDLNSISVDFEKRNWRWVVTKSYYAVFHATNALLVYKLGFFSKDHLCATIALKKENLISEELYKELGNIYERFSDIFGFAIMFEARKLSQYDTEKWKELTEEDAKSTIQEFEGKSETEKMEEIRKELLKKNENNKNI